MRSEASKTPAMAASVSAEAAPAPLPTQLKRAIALHQMGQLDRARALYEEILQVQPRHFDALNLSGLLAAQSGNIAEALRRYDRAIAIDPRQAAVYFQRGLAFSELGQFDAALADYDQAIALRADLAAIHLHRGHALCELGRFETAIGSCNQALALQPNLAEGYCVRGNAELGLDRLHDALASYRQATVVRPDYVEAYHNRGNVERALHRLDAALASYDRTIEIRPDFADGHFSRAFALLLRGDYERGWPDYEWRWQRTAGLNAKERRAFRQPLWVGKESIAGKVILLHAEQGLGDSLQFSRYVGMVAARGARVILEVHEPLLRLFAQLPGVSQLLCKGSELPDFDCHCPLMTLPLAFGTTLSSIPAPAPVRPVPAQLEAWRNKLGGGRPRVGLAWSGSAIHPGDRHRSIPVADLIEHLPQGIEYVSLQKDLREADREALCANPHITCFAEELRDFADAAALCALMDLVVCVDTSAAHLSASLGVRTWVLLPFAPDWRWLLDREDSPWYPSVRLYRQPRLGDWRTVLARVRSDLECAFGLRGKR